MARACVWPPRLLRRRPRRRKMQALPARCPFGLCAFHLCAFINQKQEPVQRGSEKLLFGFLELCACLCVCGCCLHALWSLDADAPIVLQTAMLCRLRGPRGYHAVAATLSSGGSRAGGWGVCVRACNRRVYTAPRGPRTTIECPNIIYKCLLRSNTAGGVSAMNYECV